MFANAAAIAVRAIARSSHSTGWEASLVRCENAGGAHEERDRRQQRWQLNFGAIMGPVHDEVRTSFGPSRAAGPMNSAQRIPVAPNSSDVRPEAPSSRDELTTKYLFSVGEKSRFRLFARDATWAPPSGSRAAVWLRPTPS